MLLLATLTLTTRLLTLPPALESQDAVFFVAGVERYSVAELRPHWPGYPAYVAAGKAIRRVTGDAASALRAVSILAALLSLWPIVRLAEAWGAAGSGLLAGTLWAVAPLPWLTGVRILSDPMGVCVGLWLLWSSWRGRREVAVGLGVLLVGTRLAYAPLLGSLLPLIRRDGLRIVPFTVVLVAAALAVGVLWLAIPWAVSGASYPDAAATRLAEHFGAWPHRVFSGGRFGARVVALVHSLWVHGLGGWWPGLSPLRIAPSIVFVVLTSAGVRRLRGRREVWVLLGAWTVPYLAFVLLAQDPSLPRHGLPFVAAVCLVAGTGLPARAPSWAVAAAVALALGAVSAPLAVRQSREPALGAQIARHVEEHGGPRAALLVTDDVASLWPVAEHTAPETAAGLVPLEALGRRTIRLEALERTVYSTAPSPDRPEEWVPEMSFTRSPEIDGRGPHRVWLYRHRASPRAP